MNPLYPLSSFMEKQEDPNLKLYIFSSSTTSSSSSSSSQLAFPNCFSSSTQQYDQKGNHLLHHHLQESHDHQLRHDHHQGEKSNGGISREDNEAILFSSTCLVKSSSCNISEARAREGIERSRSDNNIDDDNHEEVGDQMNKKQDQNNGGSSSAKYWMSSKMRVMQKMMINSDKKVGAVSDPKATRNNDNIQNHLGQGGKWEIRGRSSSFNNSNGVRVCSDCNTTTTPLWRSGPQGPKSLCNACGIRQRKARRAMAEAANGGGGGAVAVPSGKEMHKEKKSRLSCHGDVPAIVGHVKNKSSSKIVGNQKCWDSQSEGQKVSNLDHQNFTLRWRKNGSAFGRVFPRDEEEAAILLMELSCGLLHTC